MTTGAVIEQHRRSLLIYAERHGISQACRAFGVSRTTFYKLKIQLLKTGSLAPKPRHRPRMPNEIALSKKKLLLEMVQEHPNWGPRAYADGFRQHGISISYVTIWSHLKRFGLNRRFHRLVYLERLGSIQQPLTERTIKTIRRGASKAFKGLYPGHIVGIDTFFVGRLKGVGRIYQMTGIDLCSRFGWAKLYTATGQDASIDLVENVLLPKFYANGVTVESVLSDNGSEFKGHRFQQMLKVYDIQHLKIPVGKPMLNGTCERFQRTILEGFYQPIFRKKFFHSLAELQHELDHYLVYYNFERKHSALASNGERPINVLKQNNQTLRLKYQKLLT
jgi:transposase InsO family protein